MTTKMSGFKIQATVDPCFTDDEMDLLIKAAETEMFTGRVDGKVTDPEIRRAQVHGLDKKKYDWVYVKVWKAILEANKNYYGFSIKHLEGKIQISRYHEDDNGHYTWHMDVGAHAAERKLSLSIQLSQPSDYEGGRIGFFYSRNEVYASRDRGAIITFPSWVMHHVTPVTKGVRYSLVAWVTGPRWK